MKTLFLLLLSFLTLSAIAQVPEPAMLWLKTYGGNGGDVIGTPVTKTTDGGFIIGIGSGSDANTGNIDSFCDLSGDRNIYLKYNADASILEWSKCYQWDGDTSFGYIFPQIDGGFVFGGNYNTTGAGFYICKLDALGNIVWSHGYSKGSGLYLSCMMTTADGGYILAGESYYTDTNVSIHYGSWMNADILVMKVDSMGNKVWSKVIGGTGDDYISSVVQGPRNNYLIAGTTSSNDYDFTGNHGGGDVYVVRLDNNSNIIWHRDLGGSGAERTTDAIADSNGGVIVTASTTSIDGDVTHRAGPGENIWAVAVDSSNNIVWNNCYGGGAGDCYPNAICKATDHSMWIAGVSYLKYGEIDTIYGNGDAWFVHADSIGNFLSARVLGSAQQDEGTMIYPLSNGNVIAGGNYSATGGTFHNLSYYGASDAFLTIFAPSDQTLVKQISVINNDVEIYPNPANDKVTIKINQQKNYEVIITDIIGKVVYRANFNDKLQIPVKGWQQAIYYVQVIGVDGFKTTKKLLIE